MVAQGLPRCRGGGRLPRAVVVPIPPPGTRQPPPHPRKQRRGPRVPRRARPSAASPSPQTTSVRVPDDARRPVSRLPTPANNVTPSYTQWPGASVVRWSEMRLSLGRERGLGGHVVQKASECHRIHPNPAKTIKPRRILDHSRAEPAENSETQTRFGPPTPTATRIPGEARRSRSTESAAGGLCPFARRPGNPSPGPDGSHRGGQSSIGVGERPLGEANQLPQRTVPLLRCASPRHCTPPPSARPGGQAGQRAPPQLRAAHPPPEPKPHPGAHPPEPHTTHSTRTPKHVGSAAGCIPRRRSLPVVGNGLGWNCEAVPPQTS